jgi:Tol biopolymer transport system component
MGRTWSPIVAAVVLAVGTISQAASVGASSQPDSAQNGRIAFMRWDLALDDQTVYTANPDGTHEERLLPYPASFPRWSPDGQEIVVGVCCDAAAEIVAVDTGATRTLPRPTGMELNCGVWTGDGTRLLCESFFDTDPAMDGIYSIRASDGGGLQRVTANPGGDDIPQDVSPDGSELVFLSDRDSDALFVVGLDGNGIRRLDLSGLLEVSSASWSPDGEWIIFPARKTADDRRSLFVLHPDGTGLHEVPVEPACGASRDDRNSRGCLDPTWSPDGSKILFDILLGSNGQKQLYTIDPDGSHLTKVTHHGFVHGGEGEQAPDWGTHPLQ